jgi:hypothetical protein
MRHTAEMIHTNNHIEEWNRGRSSVADDASSHRVDRHKSEIAFRVSPRENE